MKELTHLNNLNNYLIRTHLTMDSIQKNITTLISKKISDFGLFLAKKNENEFTLEQMNNYIKDYVSEVAEEYKPVKVKRAKNVDRPKRLLTSYIVFCNILRPSIKQHHPDLTTTEVTRLMGAAWRLKAGSPKEGDDDFAEQLKVLTIPSDADIEEKREDDADKADAAASL